MHAFLSNLADKTDRKTRAKTFTASFVRGYNSCVHLFQLSIASVIHDSEMFLIIIQVVQRKNPTKQYITLYKTYNDYQQINQRVSTYDT